MPLASKNFHHLATGIFTPVDRVALTMDQLLQAEKPQPQEGGAVLRHSWMRLLDFTSLEEMKPGGDPLLPRLQRRIAATYDNQPVLDYTFFFTQVGAIHMIHRAVQLYVPGAWEGLALRRFKGPEKLVVTSAPSRPVRHSRIGLA